MLHNWKRTTLFFKQLFWGCFMYKDHMHQSDKENAWQIIKCWYQIKLDEFFEGVSFGSQGKFVGPIIFQIEQSWCLSW